MAVCVSCGDPVIWLWNDHTNSKAPVNPDPVPNGNITRIGENLYHVLTKKELAALDNPGMLDPEPPLRYQLHFIKEPCAKAFRDRDPVAHKRPKKGNHGYRN